MKAGVRQFLTVPLSIEALCDVTHRVSEELARTARTPERSGAIYSFLPAKPGAGTSTIALHAAAAVARKHEPGDSLLLDFDLNLGTIGFMLKLAQRFNVIDAAEKASQMDESLWADFVGQVDNLHVMQSGRLNPGAWLEPTQISYLLEYAQRTYPHIVLDHSGILEKYSVELLQRSERVFLVCESDPPSLYLARQKVEFLRDTNWEASSAFC
jgi:pilus assembly protein CpaE